MSSEGESDITQISFQFQSLRGFCGFFSSLPGALFVASSLPADSPCFAFMCKLIPAVLRSFPPLPLGLLSRTVLPLSSMSI